MMKKIKLHNWAIYDWMSDCYIAPEVVTERRYMRGIAEGHPDYVDGNEIKTSLIKGRFGSYVVTTSGSIYDLYEPNPAYSGTYTNSYHRLIDKLYQLKLNENV